MKQIDHIDYPNVKFGENVNITAKEIKFEGSAIIGDNVIIHAESIYIGESAIIEKNTVIKGINQVTSSVYIGDHCFIGFGNQILVPWFSIYDYSQIHNSCLCSGYKKLSIGYNCWIGQHSILNSTEELIIQNNVRIGTQSQLWTHVASGELLEGCTLYGNKPLLLEDNVWIVGGAVISPGLILKNNSIIMTGSVLTKSTTSFSTWAGVPAIEVTNKLNFWTSKTIEEKMVMMQDFVNQFLDTFPNYADDIVILDRINETINTTNKIYIVKYMSDFESTSTIFFIDSKKYYKTRSKIEVDFIKFCNGYRARFTPIVQ